MRLTGFSHAALRVRDLTRAESFYCQILGMEVAERFPDDGEVILSVGNGHFLLAETQEPLGAGLHHIAFDVADLDDCRCSLDACGVAHQQVDHVSHRSIYFHDPDGHVIECCGPGA